jgi:hypothetical protein
MQTCSFPDFINVLRPWLNRDYIRKAYLDAAGNFRLMFADGGETVYRIDDCTSDQLKDVVQLLRESDIPVEKHTDG